MKLQDYPATQWIPHKPESWPFRFGKLRQPVLLRIWTGARDEHFNPVYTQRQLPVGTMVKIVMVSRFGDVGITDDLTAQVGYHARIDLELLEPCSTLLT